MPLISVVMPAHNSSRFLAEAVASVLHQSVTDFELIIVDDASTDATLEVATSFAKDRRVKLLPSSVRIGLAGALNRAIGVAQAPFLARMDSDDIAHPQRFALQLERLRAEPTLALLGSAVREIDRDGRRGRQRSLPLDRIRVAFASLYRNPVMHPTMMIRRGMLSSAPYRSDLPSAEDYGLVLPLAREQKVANLPTVLLHYRVHGGSVTTQAHASMLLSTQRAMREQFEGASFAPDVPQPLVDALFEALYHRRPLHRSLLDILVAGFRERALVHAPSQSSAIVDDLRFALMKAAIAGHSPRGVASALATAGRRLPAMLALSLTETVHRYW